VKPPFLVVITDCEFTSFERERRELDSLAEVKVFQCRTENEVIAAARRADGLLVQYAPISRRVIEELEKCRVIARYGIGVDMIDLEAASERGIVVVNVPDYCIEEVSDHTVSLILACARKLPRLEAAVRKGNWDFSVAEPVFRMKDCTVGLVGLGKIAGRVAEKLKGFGCRLLAYDPYQTEAEAAKLDVRLTDLPQLLELADVVSLHAPLTPETRLMIGESALQRMKSTAYLINTSRGSLVDEAALAAALREGRIAGAGLDVLEKEPATPGNPLLGLENVLITPHAAFYSAESLQDLQTLTARAAAEVLRGLKRDGG
jgi:D-3-phosphoglycerate dehydrogenase